MNFEEIKILPYKLRKFEKQNSGFIYYFDSGYAFYSLKKYNGVALPTKNLIMLYGNKYNLNAHRWAKTLNHEFLHILLYELGIRSYETHEILLDLIEK